MAIPPERLRLVLLRQCLEEIQEEHIIVLLALLIGPGTSGSSSSETKNNVCAVPHSHAGVGAGIRWGLCGFPPNGACHVPRAAPLGWPPYHQRASGEALPSTSRAWFEVGCYVAVPGLGGTPIGA